MPAAIEFLIIGRTPLGGALRAGLIGVVATALGTLFFAGFWGPLFVGAIVVVAVVPIAYALSRRDDAVTPEHGDGGRREGPGDDRT
jgi:hypothetical protein